jgi:hypothetical protein
MPKSIFEYADEYRELAKKKRALLSKMQKLIKGRRITAIDSPRNDVISKKNKSFIVYGNHTLSGDHDYGEISVEFSSRGRKCFYRKLSDVIIDEDPLAEFLD